MKKIIVFLLCLITTIAQAAPISSSSFTGFYARGALGATSTRFDVSPMNFSHDFIINYSIDGDYSMYGTSPAGLLGLGYFGHLSDLFVLGFEFTGSYTKTQANYKTNFQELLTPAPGVLLLLDIASSVEGKLTNDFAFLVKPGIVSRKNTLFYLLFGPRLGNFETTASTHFSFYNPPDLATADGTSTNSAYEFGFTVGAGLQHKITETLHLGLEYAYTGYDKIHAPEVSARFTASGTPTGFFVTDTPEIKVSTNTVMLALSYQW